VEVTDSDILLQYGLNYGLVEQVHGEEEVCLESNFWGEGGRSSTLKQLMEKVMRASLTSLPAASHLLKKNRSSLASLTSSLRRRRKS
jgi:hypothetical protein